MRNTFRNIQSLGHRRALLRPMLDITAELRLTLAVGGDSC